MINDLIKKLFGKNGGSKDTAKRRLQFALVYDRLEVSDDILKDMQYEIVKVVTRYFVIDSNQLKLDITRDDDMSALVFNTPIISAKARHQPQPTQQQQSKQQEEQPKQQHQPKQQQSKSKGKKSRKRQGSTVK